MRTIREVSRPRQLLIMTITLVMLATATPASAGGNTQLEALGAPGDFVVCNDAAGATSDFPITIEGDLNGCLYQWFGPGGFTPANTYYETGTELFVGCLSDGATCGSFETTYVFTAKYADSDFNGQEWGRCQHPIIKGTGTGDFEGVTGRLDFKDNVDEGTFSMRGHIKLP